MSAQNVEEQQASQRVEIPMHLSAIRQELNQIEYGLEAGVRMSVARALGLINNLSVAMAKSEALDEVQRNRRQTR